MNTIPMAAARKRLFLLWFSGFLLLSVVLIVQTVGGVYADHVGDVWDWFTPYLVPTATLMVGTLVAGLGAAKKVPLRIDRFTYRFTMAISTFFLLLVGATIVAGRVSQDSPLILFELSKYWLLPFQGITSLALGAFFTRGKPS